MTTRAATTHGQHSAADVRGGEASQGAPAGQGQRRTMQPAA